MNNYIKERRGNWVDLSNLPIKKYNYKGEPVKKLYINWELCDGNTVETFFEGKYYTLKVYHTDKNTDMKNPIEVEFDNKVFTINRYSLLDVKLRDIINYREKEFKFNVGDTISNATVVERFRNENGKKLYKMKCNTYNEYYISNETDLKRHRGSPYVTGSKVCYANSLYSCKHIRKFIKNIEDAKTITKNSNKHILCKCPSCGLEKEYTPDILTTKGFSCNKCKTNISFPERVVMSLLDANNVEYETQKVFDFLSNRRYDFYLPKYSLVIETHGEQHYKVSSTSRWKVYKDVDEEKEKYCKENGINYISIDCRKSDFSFIVKNVVKNETLSKIITYIDKDDIMDRVDKYYFLGNKEKALKKYKEGQNVKDIARDLGVHYATVYKWLKSRGIKLKNQGYPVRCLNDGNTFESVNKAVKFYGISDDVVNNSIQNRKVRTYHSDGFPYKFEFIHA